MRILIEASEAYRNQTGIGRFSRSLIAHLPQDEVMFSPADYASRHHQPAQRTLSTRLKHFSEHLYLTQIKSVKVLNQLRPDVYHSLSFFIPLLNCKVPVVSTIFDLAYFDLPHLTDRFWGTYGRRLMPVFARRADAIVTTSDVMKTRLIEFFGLKLEKVHRIYGGIDPRFRILENTNVIRAKYQLNEPIVLYVGGWYATKNIPTLLKAFAPIRDATLVITGQATTHQQEQIPLLADALGVSVKFIGHVDDDDLIQLYNVAHVVVQPSRYEGFGLPILEAMACGTPVIVSDIPVLREIAGDAAQFFPPDSVETLREFIVSMLQSETTRQVWSKKALQRAQLFRWERTTQEIMAVWRSLV